MGTVGRDPESMSDQPLVRTWSILPEIPLYLARLRICQKDRAFLKEFVFDPNANGLSRFKRNLDTIVSN